MQRDCLFSGYMLDFASRGKYEHKVGGSCAINGATCPNCELPLMLHLRLDLSDERIKIASVCQTLFPLLYCGRCSLSWHPFVYTVIDDKTIKIAKVFRGPRQWAEWYSCVGADYFEERHCDLNPIPVRMQTICDKLNRGLALADEEVSYFASLTDSYAAPACGGYPIVDVFSQVGGRSFLAQRLDDPQCNVCMSNGVRQTMQFLCSLVNDPKHGIRFSFDGVQIVYFYCQRCNSVQVVHSV